MRSLLPGTFLCTWLLTGALLSGADRPARAEICEADLLRHLNFLASDTLEGREAGTSGGHAARVYLEGELRRLALQSAGDAGRFSQDFGAGYANLLALIPGTDETLRGEYIIVGAHYDHVGYGRRGNAYGPIGYIHNGADDNASGTASVLEIAEALALADEKPRRSVLFAWWDAEEINLNGSEHWCAHPTLPLQGVQLVINVDMVGRLADTGVIVHGARTAAGLRTLVSLSNSPTDLRLDFDRRHQRDSDHYPFFQHRIPYVFFDTGKHADYHRPTDDVDRINFAGLERVTRLICAVVRAAAGRNGQTEFRSQSIAEARQSDPEAGGSRVTLPVRLGISWYPRRTGEPVRIRSVDPGSPAAHAGLRPGDVVLQFNGRDAPAIQHLATTIAMSTGPAALQVSRSGVSEPLMLTAELAGPPIAGGCLTRLDPAEPAAAIVTAVLSDSPAADAGVMVGDRLLASPWTEPAADLPRPDDGEFVVERQGRILKLPVPLSGVVGEIPGG